MAQPTLDTFICIHRRDVDYLLETVLRSYEANFRPKRRLFFVTNDPAYLGQFLESKGFSHLDAVLMADKDWLSKKELELPGWYRQQLVKLRSYEFCETENFCNLGADTVLLQPIAYDDLVDGAFPVTYYTQHRFPNPHLWYERERVQQVAAMLQVEPRRALTYTDFIIDLFTFNRGALKDLNAYLRGLYGDDYYVRLLKHLDDKPANRNKFGEWTLYTVYLLDVLQRDITVRSTRGFLYQAHSPLFLKLYRFDTKVVHFVSKAFDIQHIQSQIARYYPESGVSPKPALQQARIPGS